MLKDLVGKHHVNVVAIGNGTACRETEELIAEIIAEGTRFSQGEARGPRIPARMPKCRALAEGGTGESRTVAATSDSRAPWPITSIPSEPAIDPAGEPAFAVDSDQTPPESSESAPPTPAEPAPVEPMASEKQSREWVRRCPRAGGDACLDPDRSDGPDAAADFGGALDADSPPTEPEAGPRPFGTHHLRRKVYPPPCWKESGRVSAIRAPLDRQRSPPQPSRF